MISKQLIKKGYENGVISIIYDNGTYGIMGIGCKIGDVAFYFDGAEAEEYDSLDEYLSSYTEEEIIDYIYNTIKDEKTAEENGIYEDEYGYYSALLHGII